MLFGWFSADTRGTAVVLESMAAALRVNAAEQVACWTVGMVGVGLLERPVAHEQFSREPARRADGSCLWMTGEAFDWPSHGGIGGAAESRTLAFRSRLLEAITAEGPRAIADLDGEYQIALWSPGSRSLFLLNDRFAALPMYVTSSRRGTAFGGGVRGVLMAPGVTAEPDPQAIREAVTFGGYRLGRRTNVRHIEMTPPATVVHVTPETVTTKRYWTWAELKDGDATDGRELLEHTRTRWSAAMSRRLGGARHPGLTLSGGLDSRAIAAEASRQQQRLRALTYGVPDADDVRIAARVARAGDADWEFSPLYADGWLDRRTDRILETDGLMDLVDLMHTEVLERLPSAFDVLLSGYVGDAVVGSTLYFAGAPHDFLNTMPYYGGTLSLPHDEALSLADALIQATPGPARFAPYEHKLPQSTNRITAAARPYAIVRRPFVDYQFFELCQRIPAAWRANHGWRERWLVSTYPNYFARIPNQRTGVPVQASRVRWQMTRATRFAWRQVLRGVRAVGMSVAVPERSYHPDDRFWAKPDERSRIEATILRNGSISCDIFGRAPVESTLRDFFERGAGPVQVIGALYVFEHYHQSLANSLLRAKAHVKEYAC
jgi:asparagine synthetase B (glutamine-hydrolysing)